MYRKGAQNAEAGKKARKETEKVFREENFIVSNLKRKEKQAIPSQWQSWKLDDYRGIVIPEYCLPLDTKNNYVLNSSADFLVCTHDHPAGIVVEQKTNQRPSTGPKDLAFVLPKYANLRFEQYGMYSIALLVGKFWENKDIRIPPRWAYDEYRSTLKYQAVDVIVGLDNLRKRLRSGLQLRQTTGCKTGNDSVQ